jgi:hypothetical protein
LQRYGHNQEQQEDARNEAKHGEATPARLLASPV